MKTEKRNIIVGQSGGPTAAINSSLAGVYRSAKERGYKKVYGMIHGVQGLMKGHFLPLPASGNSRRQRSIRQDLRHP